MPIFDQGYQHWSGTLTGHTWRWLAITRQGVRIGFKNRYLRLVILSAWMPAIALVPLAKLIVRKSHQKTFENWANVMVMSLLKRSAAIERFVQGRWAKGTFACAHKLPIRTRLAPIFPSEHRPHGHTRIA